MNLIGTLFAIAVIVSALGAALNVRAKRRDAANSATIEQIASPTDPPPIPPLKVNPPPTPKVTIIPDSASEPSLTIIPDSASEPSTASRDAIAEPSVEPSTAEPAVVEPPIVEPPIVEPPIAETIAAEPPIVEIPMTEPSVAEPPVAEISVAEPVVTEMPIVASPVAETPVEKAAVVETPPIVIQTPVIVEPIVHTIPATPIAPKLPAIHRHTSPKAAIAQFAKLNRHPATQLQAVEALSQVKSADVLPHLRQAQRSTNSQVVKAASAALQRMKYLRVEADAIAPKPGKKAFQSK